MMDDLGCPWCGTDVLEEVDVDRLPESTIIKRYDRALEAHVQEECALAQKELGINHG